MKTEACPRIGEVEASEDGRLTGDAVTSFEQHRLDCLTCHREAQALQRLAVQLRVADPVLDEVALRRLRQRVLRSAEQSGRQLETPHLPWLWWLGCGLAGVLLLLTVIHEGWWQSSSDAATVVADVGTKWSRRTSDGIDDITLFEGALTIDVQHSLLVSLALQGKTRVIVHVPDGLILDVGTRFHVVAGGDRTVEISVSHGMVIFKRPGVGDLILEEGATWQSPASWDEFDTPPFETVDSGPPPPVAAAIPHAKHFPASSAERGGSEKSTVRVRRRPSPSEDSAREQDDANADEDAVYLRWVGLLRARQDSAARALGLEYLRRFPHGFRRAEVEAGVLENAHDHPLGKAPAR